MTESSTPSPDAPTDRRSMLRHALGVAVGAAAVGAALAPDSASASSGNFLYGLPNNAGTDQTSLTTTRTGGRTLSVANTGPLGYAYGGEAYAVYGGAGTAYAINVTSAQVGAQIGGDTTGVAATTRVGPALYGVSSSGEGVRATGAVCDLVLDGTGDAPNGRLDAHQAGEVLRDRDGQMWCCVLAGAPGTWRKLAGVETAGSLHVVEPTRVYDSRWASGGGRLDNGDARGIDVSAGRNLTTGAIETANLVPPKATALQYTITVTETAGAGFVAVTSIKATGYRASSINWSAAGQSSANSTMAKLTSPELRLWGGGGGSTHVIIDVLGYYL